MSPERVCVREEGEGHSMYNGKYLSVEAVSLAVLIIFAALVIFAVLTYDPNKLSYLLCSPMT